MIEIRFHGRGGQGTVVASILMAKAFFKAGYFVQTFPVFGVERRGAPVEAYLRLDEKKILIRSNVYTPDHILIQDPKLLQSIDVTQGLKPGGWVLINSTSLPENTHRFSGFRLAFVDATSVAVRNDLGTRTHPIMNTAMLGAFARVLDMPPLDAVLAAIDDEISVKPQQNVIAAREAFDQVQIFGMVSEDEGR
jgi:pyruvate ferredoxin oxidoreductase gamma subunit/2-oxoisovalerate ferredoxin oxidoreductase gamma subunit